MRIDNLAVVVVVYNPDFKVVENIRTYISYFCKAYIVDNSDKVTVNFKKYFQDDSVEYVQFNENMGIAVALNKALYLENKCEYLLTMDQDSFFSDDMIKRYISHMMHIKQYGENIALISANWEKERDEKFMFVEECITSGNFVNIEIAKKIGGFCEKLFIDEVDYDFCHRLRACRYSILKFNDVLMQHSIGNPSRYNFFGVSFIVTNHSPLRIYYIVRNKLYMIKKYPSLKYKYVWMLIKKWIKIFFFEKEKIRKVYMGVLGVKDFMNNKYGKFENINNSGKI